MADATHERSAPHDSTEDVKVQGAPEWLYVVGVVGIILIALGSWVKGCAERREARQAATAQQQHASAPQSTPKPAKRVVQLPDRMTPCKIWIDEIQDLYTDAEPIYALPPGWRREDAVFYSGKGHMVLSGGNIHAGDWEFWSAEDPSKEVLIRAFAKQ